ncbi:MAG: DUF4065 domain-containing protein [Ruminococcaceae bacterium]|nr:DUF4065 domain-containing protein [Oscillospiraceae bacterium]
MDSIWLANYVISLFEDRDAPITNLKLQKVLYYIQGYFYRWFGKPAFLDDIYHWQYGPVVPVVYYAYNDNGSDSLESRLILPGCEIEDREKELISAIVKKCSGISTSRLVSMTHSETPWRITGSGDIIDKSSIEKYFLHCDPLEIKS